MARYQVGDDGIPGLTLALRLRLKGHDVALANGVPRAVPAETFTLPAPYRDLMLKTGIALEDVAQLVAAPGLAASFDGGTVVLPSVGAQAPTIAAALGSPAAAEWAGFMRTAADIWSTLRTGRYASRRPLQAVARRQLRDPRLRTLLAGHVREHGLDPARVGDAAAVLPYLDQTFGRWNFADGMSSLEATLRARCERLGVASEGNGGEFISLEGYWAAQFTARAVLWRRPQTSISTRALGLPWIGTAADQVAERIGRADGKLSGGPRPQP